MDFMPMFGPDSAPPASAAPDAAPVPGDGAATPLTLTGRHADGDVEVMCVLSSWSRPFRRFF